MCVEVVKGMRVEVLEEKGDNVAEKIETFGLVEEKVSVVELEKKVHVVEEVEKKLLWRR